MKSSFFFIVSACSILLFSGCRGDIPTNPKAHIVHISDISGHIVGRGVLLDNITLMTASHVYDSCAPFGCRLASSYLSGIVFTKAERIDRPRDIAYLGISPVEHTSLKQEDPTLHMPVYALVSRSGSWQRVEGSILALDTSYIGYDSSLSGSIFTGALETDIILESGESGTPVWTLSGELIGIMTASDRDRQRGYIMRP